MVFLSSPGNWELNELLASHGPRQVERGLCEVTHLFIGIAEFPYVKISLETSRMPFFIPVFLLLLFFSQLHFSSQRAVSGLEPEDQLGREFLVGSVTLAPDPRQSSLSIPMDHTHLAFLHTGQLHFFFEGCFNSGLRGAEGTEVSHPGADDLLVSLHVSCGMEGWG